MGRSDTNDGGSFLPWMTTDQYITIGTSAATLAGTLAVLYFNNRRTEKSLNKLTVHINSRVTELVKAVKGESFLEGVKSETDKTVQPKHPLK